MSVAAVRTPAEFESVLQRYLFERSEEHRAVRVGEKETSEQAAIIARYGDLFTRPQLERLREAEAAAGDEERERLFRLRHTCEEGLVIAELAEREDALENAILAARIEFRGEELPLRTAQARLAVLHEYRDRDELGELHASRSADFKAMAAEVASWRKPLLLAGGGVITSGAEAFLVHSAERLGAPVFSTFMGKTAIPTDHPLAAGLPWSRATSGQRFRWPSSSTSTASGPEG